MATQGIVSIRSKGQMLFKVVAGSNGFNAPRLAQWIQSRQGFLTGDDLYNAALSLKFGSPVSLVVQEAGGAMVHQGIDAEDIGPLYKDQAKFRDPEFNPRWDVGTAAYVEVVDLP